MGLDARRWARRLAIGAFAAAVGAASVLGSVGRARPPAPGGAWRGSFEDLVDSERALETVRWRHRIWPASNPGTKPPLVRVLDDRVLRERVDDGLRKAHALDRLWRRPLTRADLQGELDRMARDSKDPARLAETWAALGNDAARIAEVEVRPTLADRLLRELYARDPRFHGALEGTAVEALRKMRSVADLRRAGRGYAETVVRLDSSGAVTGIVADGPDDASLLPRGLANAFGERPSSRPDPRAWRRGVSRLLEDERGFRVLAVLDRGEDWLRIAAVTWDKTPFETWWAAVGPEIPATTFAPDETLRLPTLPASTRCSPDTWTRMDPGMPTPRQSHTAVWTGSEMLVWGGVEGDWLGEGWRYDPVADAWTPMSSAGAPSARAGHIAVWTGTQMIVWGGAGASGQAPGGRYDPAADLWTPMSAADQPSGNLDATAVWTGTEMIVWGGDDGGSSYYGTGGRYRPATDSWIPTSTAGAPSPRGRHTSVWSGGSMIVWGGLGYDPAVGDVDLDTGGAYDPSSDAWTPTRATGAPSPRSGHAAVWDGTSMIVWGGRSYDATGGVATYHADGRRYDPLRDRWSAMSSMGAPSAREGHSGVWTGSVMIVWGGHDDVTGLADGGRYDPSADSWAPVTALGAPGTRSGFTAVWTGSRMVVWGGSDGYDPLDAGGRYDPVTNVWTGTRRSSTRPERRFGHAAVWTGSELLVLGGHTSRSFMETTHEAFRYDPSTDTWQPTAMTSLEGPRWFESAVWSGAEAIVWGGQNVDALGGRRCLAGGLRYDPAADTWSPASAAGQPVARCFNSAVWTGRYMVIWGGNDPQETAYYNSGGRYDPTADSWSATTTSGAPAPRSGHTAIWSGRHMVVWGGQGIAGTEAALRQSGGRYDPLTDSWLPTALDAAPTGRYRHSAAWSGREMLVWGGEGAGDVSLGDGGRYDPQRDVWRPMAAVGAPASTEQAGFTCGELVAWGGGSTSGGVYDPAADTWTPMTGAVGVYPHSSFPLVSTENRIIAWSGASVADTTNTGAIYCVCAVESSPEILPAFVNRAGGGAARVSWEVEPHATGYDLVRGSLATLRSSRGDFAAATDACLANDTAVSWYDDDTPAPEGGSWYLVRAISAAGVGSYDDGSPAEAASRDPGIASSGVACP